MSAFRESHYRFFNALLLEDNFLSASVLQVLPPFTGGFILADAISLYLNKSQMDKVLQAL